MSSYYWLHLKAEFDASDMCQITFGQGRVYHCVTLTFLLGSQMLDLSFALVTI